LGLRVRDAIGGYRAYRQEVLCERDLTQVASQGYCFQIDLAWRPCVPASRPSWYRSPS